MFTVTLLTDPETMGLDPSVVESVRNAWGGGDAVFLHPAHAAQFVTEALPGNRWETWQAMQGLGIDLVATEGPAKVAKVLIADMDSTMIGQECIDELGAEAGVAEEVASITRRAMNGELSFRDSALERVALLKGLDTSVIQTVLETRITARPGGKTMVATMKRQGAYTALISGGFTSFTTAISAQLGFDEHRANELIEENGKLTGVVAEPILGREAKVEAMDEICGKLGCDRSEVVAVGDGANDLGMLAAAGLGVAQHAKPAVQDACDIRINHGDLTALLYLQGVSAEQFTHV